MSIKKLPPEVIRQHKGISFVGVATCFILYDKKGEFFMAKRSQNSRDEQGKWEIQAGGMKWGQTAVENVLREMHEESSARPKKLEFLGYRDMFRKLEDGTPTHWLALDFAALVDRKDVGINELNMFDDAGWFTMSNPPSPLHSQHKLFMAAHEVKLKKILKP
jgi:ADP-ribose pyrophosphatase YjhB (NUDIX family)